MREVPKFRQIEPSVGKAPQIYWPSPDGGDLHFPIAASFWENHNTYRTKGNYLDIFCAALMDAVHRVWVIDKFFLEDQESGSSLDPLDLFCDALSNSAVNSIRILANSSKQDVLKDAEDAIKKARNTPR